MKKTSVFSFCSIAAFVSCGGTTKDSNADSAVVNEEAFSASQPVESGIYDATRYDIHDRTPARVSLTVV